MEEPAPGCCGLLSGDEPGRAATASDGELLCLDIIEAASIRCQLELTLRGRVEYASGVAQQTCWVVLPLTESFKLAAKVSSREKSAAVAATCIREKSTNMQRACTNSRGGTYDAGGGGRDNDG